jgi:hypothetical protein
MSDSYIEYGTGQIERRRLGGRGNRTRRSEDGSHQQETISGNHVHTL